MRARSSVGECPAILGRFDVIIIPTSAPIEALMRVFGPERIGRLLDEYEMAPLAASGVVLRKTAT